LDWEVGRENSGGGRKRENMCCLKGVGMPNEIRRWRLNKVGR